MQPPLIAQLIFDLLIVLAAGLVAGVVAKRLGVSVLVGYLVVGVLIGPGLLGLLSGEGHELEYLARAGALLLLFSIGLEFPLGELVRLARYFFVAGSVQMVLVAVPVAVVARIAGLSFAAAVLVGSATALSSTVLVYKALEEWGQTGSGHGRRAIGILLFQDVALVPLMLLVPLLTGVGQRAGAAEWALLAGKSALFIAAVLAVHYAIGRWGVPVLAGLRSLEPVVLLPLIVLAGAGLGAWALGLPPALGALAAGLALSGSRLTRQFDALVLPYRETFAAVFFVSLGTLMRFDVLAAAPWWTVGGLMGVLVLKTSAAAVALRLVGLRWLGAFGMGLGLAQLGELSFVLLAVGVVGEQPVIDAATYHRMLFIALGTLILTPQLLRIGLRWAREPRDEPAGGPGKPAAVEHAVVIGAGPVGSRVASHLETLGIGVWLVDLSPINLQPFAQQGFGTVAGDATDAEILRHAGADACPLAVVTVPSDAVAADIVATVRKLNPTCRILVRCRFQSNVANIGRAGADAVVSEEVAVGGLLLRLLDNTAPPGRGGESDDR